MTGVAQVRYGAHDRPPCDPDREAQLDREAVDAYARAIQEVCGVRPESQTRHLHGETFHELLVPVGPNVPADPHARHALEDRIHDIVLQINWNYGGRVIIMYDHGDDA